MVWDVECSACIQTLDLYASTLVYLAREENGRLLVTGDQKLSLSDIWIDQQLAMWYADASIIDFAMASPQRFVIGDATGVVTVLDLVEELPP